MKPREATHTAAEFEAVTPSGAGVMLCIKVWYVAEAVLRMRAF